MIQLSNKDGDRRFKIVYIAKNVLLNCLVINHNEKHDTIVKTSLDVPPDTEIKEVFYDHARMADCIILYNPKWDSIPVGDSFPIIETNTTYITSNPALYKDPVANIVDKTLELRNSPALGFEMVKAQMEEFYNSKLGEPYDESWRDKPPLL